MCVGAQQLRDAAAPLGLRLSRIAQLQAEALTELTDAVAAASGSGEVDVVGALRGMVADVDYGADA